MTLPDAELEAGVELDDELVELELLTDVVEAGDDEEVVVEVVSSSLQAASTRIARQRATTRRRAGIGRSYFVLAGIPRHPLPLEPSVAAVRRS